VKENPEKPCRNITCEDSNALYLYCAGSAMPTGMYVRRQAFNGFKPQLQYRYMKQFRWMDAEAAYRGVTILHAMNHAEEKRVGNYLLDGFEPGTKNVYEFMGCKFHQHAASGVCLLGGQTSEREKRNEAYEKTVMKIKTLERVGFNVIVCWECQYEARLLEMGLGEEVREELEGRYLPEFYRLTRNMSVDEFDILAGVRNGSAFGLIEVDIHVPEELRPNFAHFPPLFVCTEIGREDVGELMKEHAEREGELEVSEMVVGKFFFFLSVIFKIFFFVRNLRAFWSVEWRPRRLCWAQASSSGIWNTVWLSLRCMSLWSTPPNGCLRIS